MILHFKYILPVAANVNGSSLKLGQSITDMFTHSKLFFNPFVNTKNQLC